MGQGCGAEAGDQRAERDLGFDSGQRCAVAEVDAAAEAEVLVVWAGGVVGSNRSGSRNRLGSRLPEASTSTRGAPLGMVMPATSTLAKGVRCRMWTAGS